MNFKKTTLQAVDISLRLELGWTKVVKLLKVNQPDFYFIFLK